VEILRDALLHAFHDIEGLEPHDIVIMCADIEATAPLIEASFARTFIHNGRPVLMPVVVADRSLRHVDDGAQLLHNLVSMVSGRFAASDVLGIATSPLVLREFALGADDVAVWERIVDTAVVRWGASPAHRARKGVDAQQISAHSWSLALERAMLGAVLPDGMPAPEIGNVVPLRDIDASEIDSVTALARIVSVLVELEKATSSAPENPNLRTITEWALLIETALSQLSDPADGEIDNALQVIDQIRDYVRLVDDIIPVRFDHFAMQLLELISEAPGRQPLRTGAITATSMVPLRGVPFKVVCLVGFDEGSVTTGEVEGDDLIERQRFVGDSDPRIDQRRAILDAVCAASHRVVITCNGRSIKDNKEVPLITPFAELLDLCERCGVGNQHGHTDIEHQHPRHFSSIKNFTRGAVLPGIIWSHDEVAKQSVVQQGSSARGAKPTPKLVSAPSDKSLIDIKRFRTLSADPLRLFINDHLAINTWKEQIEEESATIPLELVKKDLTALCADLLAARLAGFDDAHWETVQDSAGMLPIGKYKTATVAMVVGRVNSLQEIAGKWNINLSAPETFDIDIDTKYGTISGSIVLYRSPDGYVAMHPFTRAGFKKIDNEEVALNLLFLAASGYFFEGTVNIGLHGKEKDKCQAWFVELGPDIDQTDAIERLENLIELMAQAESVPLPMFGDAAMKLDDDEEGARKAFATRVKADAYPASNECLIYGPGPDFNVVYPAKGIERSFFVSLVNALPVRDKELEKLRGSIKPPDNSRAQQRYVFV
jgi:exodeoxyribonuclease V gamma subunit